MKRLKIQENVQGIRETLENSETMFIDLNVRPEVQVNVQGFRKTSTDPMKHLKLKQNL